MAGTMSEVVYANLRSQILSGQRRQGDPLSESEIAREHGVSKTPVREALQRLVHAELVDVLPSRGYAVHRLTIHEVRDVLAVRELVECEAAALAARHATHRELDEIRKIAEVGYDKRDAASILQFHDANHALHSRVARASGNDYLARLVVQVLDRLQLVVIGELDVGDPQEIVQEHLDLVLHLGAHDPDAARACMAAQVRHGLGRILGGLGLPDAARDRLA